MQSATYLERRGELETYFDRTAMDAWARLTSDAPVSRIRATVRAGRERMRATLLSWLPRDLLGLRVLDAGCGTGLFAVELARRGAAVTATDLSPNLVALAAERAPRHFPGGSVDFRAGDMLDPALGTFDFVIGMDSLIHYRAPDTIKALQGLVGRTRLAVLFTFAPRTPALTLMHGVGRLFPRGNRAPAIEPVSPGRIGRLIARDLGPAGWRAGRSERVVSGFYTSQALELVRA